MQDNKFNHVMVDLETLGQEPGSVILSVSAVQFNIETGETKKRFDEVITLESSLKQGLKIDPATLAFWSRMPNQLNYFLTYKNQVSLATALANFGRWLNALDESLEDLRFGSSNYDVIMWGRGPRFDFGLLSYAYNSLGYPRMPWNFRNEMCVRTMELLRPELKKKAIREKDNTEHNGIDDCLYQIKYITEIYNQVKNK